MYKKSEILHFYFTHFTHKQKLKNHDIFHKLLKMTQISLNKTTFHILFT